MITGTYTTSTAAIYAVTGQTTADPRWFTFVIADGSPNQPYYGGYLNGHELGIMSGAAAKDGTTVGFHAVRLGDL